jgi:hypothetical protein
MNPHQKAWQKLTAAARAHRDERPAEAPFGFATRVAACACVKTGSDSRSLLEKFALRCLIAAFTLSLAATAYGVVGAASDDAELVADNIVAEVLERS